MTLKYMAKAYGQANENEMLLWIIECLLGASSDPDQWLKYYRKLDKDGRMSFRFAVQDICPEKYTFVLEKTRGFKY